MKKLITALSATAVSVTLFTGTAGAANFSIYGGFANGNPDLYPNVDDEMVTASAPGVGDSYDHLQGDWASGNPDIFTSTRGATSKSKWPNIYSGFEGNPDL